MPGCPFAVFNECRKNQCHLYIRKEQECAIVLTAIYLNKPPKEDE